MFTLVARGSGGLYDSQKLLKHNTQKMLWIFFWLFQSVGFEGNIHYARKDNL